MMKSRGLAMVVLIFASFMDLMDATVVNVALPTIQHDLHASPAALEWIVGGYTLTFAVALITGGRLGDIFGRQRLFLVGVAGFTLASLAAAVAVNADMLVICRLVQGAFAAIMVPQVLASVQALYKAKERAAIYGVIGAVTGMAAIAGPLVGGGLVSSNAFGVGWRSIFVINLPIGVALFVAAILWVPNTRSTHPLRLDVPGVLLITAGLTLLIYPLVEGRQLGWPAWTWVMLAAAPVVLAAFVPYQRRRQAGGTAPLVPMTLFANRGFSAGVVTQFAFMGAMAGFFLILTLYLQLGLGFSAIGAGLVLLPFTLGAFVGSAIGVPLATKVGKPMVFLGAGMQAGALVWVRQVVHAHGNGLSGWNLLWPLALAGAGLGLMVIAVVDLALATVDVRDAGAASGVFSTFQQVGGALGIAIIGVVFFNHVGADYSPERLRGALLIAAWVAIAAYLLAAAASLLLPTSKLIRHEEADELDVPDTDTAAVTGRDASAHAPRSTPTSPVR